MECEKIPLTSRTGRTAPFPDTFADMTQETEKNDSLPPEENSAQPVTEASSSDTSETQAPAEVTPVEISTETAEEEVISVETPADQTPATAEAEASAEPSAETSESATPENPDAASEQNTEQTAPPSAALLTADSMPLVQVVEALLFSTDMPLSAAKLADTCGLESAKPIKDAVAELNAAYEQRQAAYRIEDRAGGYQILTLPQYADYITRLVRKKDEGRLTPAMLETLAIISYKQPIIRADIEAIRGVGAGEVLRSLMEHNLVKIVGRAEEIGRPMLYGTTRYFLEVFGLASLKDLPKAEQLKEPK